MPSTADTCFPMAHSKATKNLALALLGAGSTASAVAEQIGVSLRTVQRWRTEAPDSVNDDEHTEHETPRLTLASIAVDGKMPAGARVQAAKALLDMTPVHAVVEPEAREMSEFERFEVSIMAGWCYAELLLHGRHSLNEAQLRELGSRLDELYQVLVKVQAQRASTKSPPHRPNGECDLG